MYTFTKQYVAAGWCTTMALVLASGTSQARQLGIVSRLYDDPAIPALRSEWSSPFELPVDERVQSPR